MYTTRVSMPFSWSLKIRWRMIEESLKIRWKIDKDRKNAHLFLTLFDLGKSKHPFLLTGFDRFCLFLTAFWRKTSNFCQKLKSKWTIPCQNLMVFDIWKKVVASFFQLSDWKPSICNDRKKVAGTFFQVSSRFRGLKVSRKQKQRCRGATPRHQPSSFRGATPRFATMTVQRYEFYFKNRRIVATKLRIAHKIGCLFK